MSTDDSHLSQAIEWLTQLQSGEFSPAQQHHLDTWRKANPAHEQAWQQAQLVWQCLEGLRGRSIPGKEPLLPEFHQRQIIKSGRYRLSLLAIASCAVLAVLIPLHYPPSLWRADYMTKKGEQRSLTLADGSIVTLNSNSAVSIHFDNQVRRVDVLQGEAFFAVVKAKQPFVVKTTDGEVRAVGTEFAVQLRESDTQVELVEGKVELQDESHQHFARLTAGQSAQIGNGQIQIDKSRQTDNFALWREGYLQFNGLPLEQAIAEINRYRPGRVVLLNSNLARQRVSGLFRLEALDQAILGFKAAVPQLQSFSFTSYWVVLR
ncbi:FecR family protein [Methylovulum miyakonense]|uniref:FecR family protein n=1 Tax=Methylovulum miyakonense TaxID=645578 RepID=UPI00037ADE7F|nr:FecR family protein [Methylovulum miyakonense]